MESQTGSTIIQSHYIFDATGATWGLIASAANGLQITRNGTVDANTANVTLLLYWDHVVYQQNSAGGWWSWTNSAWLDSHDPRPAATPIPAPPPTPVESANGATIATPGAGFLIDAQRVSWGLVASAANGVQITRNGTTDPNTANVTLLLYWNHVIYQQNSAGGWWSWTNSAWLDSHDPRPSPVPAPPPAPTPAPAGNLVVVNPAQTGAVLPASIYGLSCAMWTGNHDYAPAADPAFWALANQFPVPLLRHNWELNTFMDILFPSRTSGPNWGNLDTFLNNTGHFTGFFNNAVGRTVVTLGFPSWLDYTRAADQALFGKLCVEVAQHFAAKGQPCHWWELINEPDGHVDIGSLCAMFNAMSGALKAYDNANKCGGLSYSWYQQGDYSTFVRSCGGAGHMPDFLSWHNYVTNGSDGKSAQQCLLDSLDGSTARTARQQATRDGLPASAPFFLGEYNVDGGNYTDPYNDNMVGAVAAAGVTHAMITSGANVTMAALWETVNDGSYAIFGNTPNYKVAPTGRVLAKLAATMPGTLVGASVSSTLPHLAALATTNNGKLAVQLTNYDMNASYAVQVQGFSGTVTHWEISAANPNGATSTLAASALVNLTIPALSVVVITG